MSHFKWLIHTSLTLAIYPVPLMLAHSAVIPNSGREGERGYWLWEPLAPLTLFTTQGRPFQRLLMQDLTEATGTSPNRIRAWRSCFFSTFFPQLSANSGSATENSAGAPQVWHS